MVVAGGKAFRFSRPERWDLGQYGSPTHGILYRQIRLSVGLSSVKSLTLLQRKFSPYSTLSTSALNLSVKR
jgi:hypothetical protein